MASEPSRLPGYRAQPRYEKIVRLAPMRYGLTVRLASGETVIHELGRFIPPPPPPRAADP